MTRHLAIVGCTASGKSALALAVAEAFGDVELVSLDSMQVYRGMDIGTAKPTPAEQAAVPHHLIDVVAPDEEWSVRATQRAVTAALADIEARGKRALLVGGTGLYVRAVVDQLAVPARDNTLRAELDETLDTATAYARVQALDPAAAARIEPNNRRRILRALEVLTAGTTFSDAGPGLDSYGPPAIDVTLVGVWLPRPVLATRIEDRFAAMREAGLLDEVRALPADVSRTARQAIGYKELFAHLDGEIPNLDEAFDLAVRRTRKFARRQRMWFRRDPRIRWIGTFGNPEALTPFVLALWKEPVAATARAS